MSGPARWWRRLRRLIRGGAVDREMEAEMRLHVSLEAEERVRAGATPEQARREALRAFGGVERYKEEGRQAYGLLWLRDLASDVRYAVRTLAASPSYTLVAVATLALGIGANAAIFGVVDGVLLRQLPYPDPESLVSVWEGGHPEATYDAVRERLRSFESVASYSAVGVGVSGDGEPVHVQGARVSPSFFRVLGVEPARGRALIDEDADPAPAEVVVVAYELWRDRYGSDPSLVGREIRIEGRPHTVAGIMPPGFGFPGGSTRLWLPAATNPAEIGAYWGSYGLRMIGRLAPGVTPASAITEVRALAAQLRLENPVWTPGPDWGADARVLPLRDALVGDVRPALLVLLGAVGLVLLIACANVANLCMARGVGRGRELAVRAALGAGRGRLVRQLLSESLVLAAVGGAVGLLLATGAARALVVRLPQGMPRVDEIGVDARVFAFTAAVAVLTAVLFGLAPALRASRLDPAGTLRADGRGGGSRAQRRVAAVLVAAQVALAVVLVIGASLLVQSLWKLRSVDPGFTERVLGMRVTPPRAGYSEPERALLFFEQVLERVRALPDVRSAAIASHLPFDGQLEAYAMWIDGFTTDPNALDMMVGRRMTPGYLETLGIALVRGRGIEATDRPGTPLVALVDEEAVRRFWSGRDAVGGRIRYPWGGDWITVVGVVANTRDENLTGEVEPSFYVPFAQRPGAAMSLAVATAGQPAAIVPRLRDAVAEIDASVPISDVRTLGERLAASVSGPRFTANLLLAFALLALVLGAVGIYGVVAYAVGQRAREFGVRMALGASRGAIVRDVLRHGAVLVAAGTVLGVLGAYAVTGVLQGLLFGVEPRDGRTFLVVPFVLGAIALLASYLPARRAARVEPISVMRSD